MVFVIRAVRVSSFFAEVIHRTHSALAFGVIFSHLRGRFRGFLQSRAEIAGDLELYRIAGGLDDEGSGVADGGLCSGAHGSVNHELVASFAVREGGGLKSEAVYGAFDGDSGAFWELFAGILGHCDEGPVFAFHACP